MILGRIIGKTTTKKFSFKIDTRADKFQYVQVMHKEYGYVLCQIIEIEREKNEIALCIIIGFKKDNKICLPRSPFQQNIEVLDAENNFIKDILDINQKDAAYIGKLETRDIKIFLDLNKLLTKHIAIIAKTGAGKSYTAGVLIEEILEKKVPLLIIDPHGEYSQMRFPNSSKEEIEMLKKDNISPEGYKDQIVEYGDTQINESLNPIRLNEELSPQELLHILPAKLSQSQKAMLYSLIKDLNPVTLNNLIDTLSEEQDITSLNLASILDYMKSLGLFSPDFIQYNELIQPGKCSIINLKGIPPEVQEIIVYKLLKDLFEQRKLGNIAPFITIIEEVHNFAPERSFGEAKSSGIIRTIASEGRKFGLGLCVLTQRPARLDKNVLSQCNSHIILKVTNPNDLKSIISSVENVSSETEEEIKNIPIGTALVTGIVDMPLLVKIRPRKSKHGGATINILEESQDLLKGLNNFNKKELLPIILPKTSPKDLKLIEGKEKISPFLIPAMMVTAEKSNKKFRLLVEAIKGHVVRNIDTKDTIIIPETRFSNSQTELLDKILSLEKFNLAGLNEKTGKPILKLKEYLEFFQKQNIIKKEKDTYRLTQSALLLKHPEKFQFLDKIQFKQINYKSKLRPKAAETEIRNKLNFITIEDIKNCYMVYYRLE
ncbi:MAG: ATP-binding protein [Nanoarchaeota archaeon]|nr:ATP-binding protein [Nanoarchaeota archaeon]